MSELEKRVTNIEKVIGMNDHGVKSYADITMENVYLKKQLAAFKEVINQFQDSIALSNEPCVFMKTGGNNGS